MSAQDTLTIRDARSEMGIALNKQLCVEPHRSRWSIVQRVTYAETMGQLAKAGDEHPLSGMELLYGIPSRKEARRILAMFANGTLSGRNFGGHYKHLRATGERP